MKYASILDLISEKPGCDGNRPSNSVFVQIAKQFYATHIGKKCSRTDDSIKEGHNLFNIKIRRPLAQSRAWGPRYKCVRIIPFVETVLGREKLSQTLSNAKVVNAQVSSGLMEKSVKGYIPNIFKWSELTS